MCIRDSWEGGAQQAGVLRACVDGGQQRCHILWRGLHGGVGTRVGALALVGGRRKRRLGRAAKFALGEGCLLYTSRCV